MAGQMTDDGATGDSGHARGTRAADAGGVRPARPSGLQMAALPGPGRGACRGRRGAGWRPGRGLRGLAAAGVLALAGCGGTPDLEDHTGQGPELELERFLDGRLTAHGVFQDRFGDLRRAFVVDAVGEWDGEVLTLTEDFTYEDGSTERRVWELTQTGPESWIGTAEGVVGTAAGEEAGNAFNWRYTIDLNTPDGTLRASFDDWLWRLDDRVMVNRAYVTKWGIEIGTLSIFFRREEPLASGEG